MHQDEASLHSKPQSLPKIQSHALNSKFFLKEPQIFPLQPPEFSPKPSFEQDSSRESPVKLLNHESKTEGSTRQENSELKVDEQENSELKVDEQESDVLEKRSPKPEETSKPVSNRHTFLTTMHSFKRVIQNIPTSLFFAPQAKLHAKSASKKALKTALEITTCGVFVGLLGGLILYTIFQFFYSSDEEAQIISNSSIWNPDRLIYCAFVLMTDIAVYFSIPFVIENALGPTTPHHIMRDAGYIFVLTRLPILIIYFFVVPKTIPLNKSSHGIVGFYILYVHYFVSIPILMWRLSRSTFFHRLSIRCSKKILPMSIKRSKSSQLDYKLTSNRQSLQYIDPRKCVGKHLSSQSKSQDILSDFEKPLESKHSSTFLSINPQDPPCHSDGSKSCDAVLDRNTTPGIRIYQNCMNSQQSTPSKTSKANLINERKSSIEVHNSRGSIFGRAFSVSNFESILSMTMIFKGSKTAAAKLLIPIFGGFFFSVVSLQIIGAYFVNMELTRKVLLVSLVGPWLLTIFIYCIRLIALRVEVVPVGRHWILVFMAACIKGVILRLLVLITGEWKSRLTLSVWYGILEIAQQLTIRFRSCVLHSSKSCFRCRSAPQWILDPQSTRIHLAIDMCFVTMLLETTSILVSSISSLTVMNENPKISMIVILQIVIEYIVCVVCLIGVSGVLGLDMCEHWQRKKYQYFKLISIMFCIGTTYSAHSILQISLNR